MKYRKSAGFGLIAVAMATAALVSACGGGSDAPDPLQKYREQTVGWTACDPTLLSGESERARATFEQAGDRVRCAFVKAPLDWSHPDRGDITIAMMRTAAGIKEQKRGTLFFNPGGPGEDGLHFSLKLFAIFKDSDPSSPQGAQQLQLLNEFDMVGFSPRGVGASTRLSCSTNELARSVDVSPQAWDTPANISNSNYNGGKTAEACLKNPITPYINSDATARDLDLMRGLVGDEKLNYVGYSYGTWLGSWYAALFPDRVGRMLLDSSVDFTVSFEQAVAWSQPLARQQLFDEVMVPYAVRHADLFALGHSVQEVQAIAPELNPFLQQLLGASWSHLSYSRGDEDAYLGILLAARGLDRILNAEPDPLNAAAVKRAIQEHEFGSSSPEFNSSAQKAAASLYSQYAQMRYASSRAPISLGASEATRIAVGCNDTPSITNLSLWESTIRSVSKVAPLHFGGALQGHACAFWGGPSVNKPDLAAIKPLNILFAQTQYDAATYTVAANQYFAQLSGAQRVYVKNDFQHAVYPYGDTCVDPRVTAFLLGKPFSEREIICEGLPFAQDAVSSTSRSSQKSSAGGTSAYLDPARAMALIKELKQSVKPTRER